MTSFKNFSQVLGPIILQKLHLLKLQILASDQGNFSLLVLLDLSAVFDTIDHNILISRVSTVGPKAGVLVHARARRVSTVTSGARSCPVGTSSEPMARVFWPAEYFGPKQANWGLGLRRGQGERRGLSPVSE